MKFVGYSKKKYCDFKNPMGKTSVREQYLIYLPEELHEN